MCLLKSNPSSRIQALLRVVWVEIDHSIYRGGWFGGVFPDLGTWVPSRADHKRGWFALVCGEKWGKESGRVGGMLAVHRSHRGPPYSLVMMREVEKEEGRQWITWFLPPLHFANSTPSRQRQPSVASAQLENNV